VATREQNERRFKNWEDLPDGGRRYWYDVIGKRGWLMRYVKNVDANEVTISFYQEIYNAERKLIPVHQKFLEDTGHQVVED